MKQIDFAYNAQETEVPGDDESGHGNPPPK